MQVNYSNNVKFFNLTFGKALSGGDFIENFEMPERSTEVEISPDGEFILVTGNEPRVRCYNVNNSCMEFERFFQSEVLKFEILSDDFSKLSFLKRDRSIELHNSEGHLDTVMIPESGRDLAYRHESCDLLIVGEGSEIYRLNLNKGKFQESYQTQASSINKIMVYPEYDIFACGTMEGTIEGWDPRAGKRIESLDCALDCVRNKIIMEGFPSVTALYFKNETLGVGTFTGQTLLYDIRNNKPFMISDNSYGLPIKNIDIVKSEEFVVSTDPKCVTFWKQNQNTDIFKNKPYFTIQAPAHLNDMCIVPNTGLLFLANEEKKILTYFIPSIGSAPQWCSFLDKIAEELEETKDVQI